MMHPNLRPHNRPFFSAVATLLMAVFLADLGAGCAPKNRSDFAAGPVGPLAVNSFKREWSADLKLPGRDDLIELHLRDDLLFAYSRAHTSYCLSRTTGVTNFINEVTGPKGNLHPPVILKDYVVYPTTTSFEVYSRQGRKVKSYQIDYAIRSDAAGAGTNLYAGADVSGGGRLVAVDLDRPYRVFRWELMTFGGISAAPAIHQGVIYAGSEDGRIYAVNENRAAVWPLENGVFLTPGRIVADVKADDYGVYFASTDSKLYCVDRGAGKVRWQYFAGKALTQPPAVLSEMVLQYVPGSGIVAIDKTQGKYNREARWNVPEAVQVLSADEMHIYLRRRDNVVIAADRKTGKVEFQTRRSDLAVFATNTKDSLIYAATRDGRVICISPVIKAGIVGEMVLLDHPAPADQTAIAGR